MQPDKVIVEIQFEKLSHAKDVLKKISNRGILYYRNIIPIPEGLDTLLKNRAEDSRTLAAFMAYRDPSLTYAKKLVKKHLLLLNENQEYTRHSPSDMAKSKIENYVAHLSDEALKDQAEKAWPIIQNVIKTGWINAKSFTDRVWGIDENSNCNNVALSKEDMKITFSGAYIQPYFLMLGLIANFPKYPMTISAAQDNATYGFQIKNDGIVVSSIISNRISDITLGLRQKLWTRDVKIVQSQQAGRYVCDETYYDYLVKQNKMALPDWDTIPFVPQLNQNPVNNPKFSCPTYSLKSMIIPLVLEQ